MSEPKKSNEPKESSGPTETKRGGFGEFSELYRARWAANHPHMRRKLPGAETPDLSTSTDATGVKLDRNVQDEDGSP